MQPEPPAQPVGAVLGLAPARELNVALVERRLDLKEQYSLLDVQHLGHNAITVAG